MSDELTADGLRRYGPGKFDLWVDSYVYGLSLDGSCDEEMGEADGPGWYGLIRGVPLAEPIEPLDEAATLEPAEVEFLRNQAGVILSENSDGFVSVDYFERDSDLMAAWGEVVEDVGKWYGDGSDNGEGV